MHARQYAFLMAVVATYGIALVESMPPGGLFWSRPHSCEIPVAGSAIFRCDLTQGEEHRGDHPGDPDRRPADPLPARATAVSQSVSEVRIERTHRTRW